MPQETFVKAVCARCGTDLVPAFRGRLRCPRASACGYGGVQETRSAAEAFRKKRAVLAVDFTPHPVRSPVPA